MRILVRGSAIAPRGSGLGPACGSMETLVDATRAEARAVGQLLQQTMPDAVVVRVQRNQRDILHRQYEAQRGAVDAEAGETHERWLWNGNDSIAENISKGFDLRYASQEFNKYGVGIYFAADARLSAFFERSTRNAHGEKTIILARVALGIMAERLAVPGQARCTGPGCGQNWPFGYDQCPSCGTSRADYPPAHPELQRPEWKLPPPGAQSATSRHRIEAIVYENHQAFPQYLVTYTAGPRPSPYGGQLVPALRVIDTSPATVHAQHDATSFEIAMTRQLEQEEARAEVANVRGERDAMQQQRDATQTERDAFQQERDALQEQLDAAREDITALKQQLHEARARPPAHVPDAHWHQRAQDLAVHSIEGGGGHLITRSGNVSGDV
eukprot:COSAG06_NODE_26_length_32102_cov_250.952911_6_plen_384_part_00